MIGALDDFEVGGVKTTIGLHRNIVRHPDYQANRIHTRWLETSFLQDQA
jgi:acetyl-CoA carboxylase biotin carboxylase subunit